MAKPRTDDIRTSTLLGDLFKAPDLKSFIRSNAQALSPPSFHEYISALCNDASDVPERVVRRAMIDRTYGHQLFNGTRKPSRDKAIQLAFGLGLDLDGAQALLRIARHAALYPKIKRDAVILRCLNERKAMLETQDILQELGLSLLGGDRSG